MWLACLCQDALGVQARRVAITPAKNTTFGSTKWDGTAVLQPCKARTGVPAGSVASTDAPLWKWKNTTVPGPAKFLFIGSCNATDAHQQWLFSGHEGQLKNVAMKTCLDANASSDPAALAACSTTGTPSQIWTLHENGRLSAENMKVCLSIWSSVGPDAALAYCKSATSPHDENEVFRYDAAMRQLMTNSSGKQMCVTAMKAPPSGLLSTVVDGKEYCLLQQSNVEGGLSGELCPTGELGGKSPFSYHPVPVAGKPELAILFGAPGPDWNNDEYGSGPHPHTRYITPNGGCCGPAGGTTWRVDYSKLAAGEAVQLEADSDVIVDDDGIGGVSTTGGGFCMGLATFGGLEVWAGPLVDGKIVVTLFNRSPAAEEITAHWSDIGAAGSYSVRDVWAAAERGKATGNYSASVEAHATMLLVLTPMS